MTVEQFKGLRHAAKLTQAEVADKMGLTARTIAAWEASGDEKPLSLLEGRAMRELCIETLLRQELVRMAKEAHDRIPSELSCLWLVVDDECRILPGTSRNHFEERVENIECRYPLNRMSLTTNPLRSGQIMNLAGDYILRHPDKRHKQGRGSFFLKDLCESLLHIPVFAESPRGPRPVMLLQMQNRLDVEAKAVVVPEPWQEFVYTLEEAREAQLLAIAFRDELWPHLWLLDLVETREVRVQPPSEGQPVPGEPVDKAAVT